MTEDLITDLSKLSGLFVIARNSVFTYKNKAVKVKQVAEELGVRYVLEGSVRRVGDQVRINAQLIDATTGGHLWAERYDGLLQDVFAMRSESASSITAAIQEALSERMPIDLENLGEQVLKGFDYSVQIYRVELRPGESILPAEKSSQRDSPTKTGGLLVAVVAIALVVAGSTAYWYQSRVPQEEPA